MGEKKIDKLNFFLNFKNLKVLKQRNFTFFYNLKFKIKIFKFKLHFKNFKNY